MPCCSPATERELYELTNNIAYDNLGNGFSTGCRFLPTVAVYFKNNLWHSNLKSGAAHWRMGDAHHRDSQFANNREGDIKWMNFPILPVERRFDAQVQRCTFLGEGSSLAIYGPRAEYFLVSDNYFKGYGNKPVLKMCLGCCCAKGPNQGTYTYRFEKLAFESSTKRLQWVCPWKQIYFDIDGQHDPISFFVDLYCYVFLHLAHVSTHHQNCSFHLFVYRDTDRQCKSVCYLPFQV